MLSARGAGAAGGFGCFFIVRGPRCAPEEMPAAVLAAFSANSAARRAWAAASSAAEPTVITAASEARAVANASSILSCSSATVGGVRCPGSSQSCVLSRSAPGIALTLGRWQAANLGRALDFRSDPANPRDARNSLRNPRDFFQTQAIGAPEPLREIPVKPSRMIHFLDFSNEKMVAKAADIAQKTDILLGNLEDAIPVDRKEAARQGLIKAAKESDFGQTALWTRVNSLESPWVLDDLTTLITEIGDKLEVVMVPKVEGPWDIHYVDRLLAQLEAKANLDRPILVHAILETAQGVVNVEEIAAASPRMQGMSFGPADLAASRRMKTTRVGGGHPGYRSMEDPADPENPEAGDRVTAQQDPWHYSIARMVDACASTGILPFYGPFGDIKDTAGCETQFRAAFLLGCVGAWSLHPVQIGIAKQVFSPPPDEVKFAKKVLDAIPDGRGVHMIDGKMQDDATWKQCKVMVELAEMLAQKDPELAEAYGL
jgi:malyl-CoA/(S)-citramalyl-CoA lyase